MTLSEIEVSKKLAEFRGRNARLALPSGFTPKVPLYSHQVMGLHYGIRLSNAGLLYEQGLGKTAIAINIMRYRIEKGQVSRVLVIAPKNVLYTWEMEVAKHSNLRSVILHNSNWRIRKELFKQEAEFYLINYDGVSLFYDEIQELDPTALILDESTRIKNIQAQRTKKILKLSKEIPYKLILTGTPITNSPMDIFCQIQALDPTIFEKSNFWQWRASYFKDVGTYYPKWVPRHGTLEKIQQRIYTLAVRYEKKECLDLPEKIYQNLYIEMNSEQEDAYTRIKGNLVVSLGEKKVKTKMVMHQLMKLNQIESGWIKSDIVRNEDDTVVEDGEIFDLGAKNPKIEALSELFDDLLYENKKVIIWTKFTHSLKLIENLCKKKKIKYVTYYGGTKENDKRTAVADFQNSKEIKVFISQVRAGAFGTTLTAADTAIYFELDDDVELYEQSQDRNHRIGATGVSINYIHLLVKNGVGEKILTALKEKKSLAQLIIEKKKL